MLQGMQKYFSKLKSRLTPVIYETTTIAAGPASKIYNITTYFADHARYDLRSCRVTVLTLNKEAGAATTNMYINSQAQLVYGIDATGKLVITNFDVAAVDILVSVEAPTVLK